MGGALKLNFVGCRWPVSPTPALILGLARFSGWAGKPGLSSIFSWPPPAWGAPSAEPKFAYDFFAQFVSIEFVLEMFSVLNVISR